MASYRSELEFLRSLKRFNALSNKKYAWHTGISEEDHLCEFGHSIPPEQLHFQKLLDTEGERRLSVCKPCMEKLVYVTVDSDQHAREVTSHLYQESKPTRNKVTDMMTH